MKTGTEQAGLSSTRHKQIRERLRRGCDRQARCLLRDDDRDYLTDQQYEQLIKLAREHDCERTESFLAS